MAAPGGGSPQESITRIVRDEDLRFYPGKMEKGNIGFQS
jgi:hypothetical protein